MTTPRTYAVCGAMLVSMPVVREGERALAEADEAFARFDLEALVTHLSEALRAFTAEGAASEAALTCVRLGQVMSNFFGNLTAGRAWFARAERLVADLPPCVEQGWVAVAAMGCDVDDPAVLLERAELALDRARRFGDLDLETKALADGGLAHVEAGRVAEGMAMLDEAMALACGPTSTGDAAAKSVCSFFTACYFAMDFDRAASWTDLLRQQGLIGPAPGPQLFLSSHCDSVQATLLMELGRWSDAEALLLRAQADFEAAMGPSWHAAIALADLRIRQGRFHEAESLLLGKEQAPQALLPFARLHQERGDHELALAAATRGLRLFGDDRLRAAELLGVQIDALLALGELDRARQAAADLDRRLADTAVAGLAARRDAVLARLQALDDPAGAAATLRAALDRLDPQQHPVLRDDLADQLRALDRATDARPGRPPAADGSSTGVAVLALDGRWCTATWGPTSVRLPASKGLRYLAVLVEGPGAERHALDLVDRVEGLGTAGDPDRRALGDLGPALDGPARTAYRREIEAVRGEIDDLLERGDLDAAEARQADLDLLVAQLAQAFGIGGTARPSGSAAEKARLNVTRALRSALTKLDEALPGAGAALDRRVRTGLFCAYEPEADDEVRWIVQP